MPDAEPGRKAVPTLHPAEHPGDGPQVFKLPALRAARRTRSDLRVLQFIDRCCLLKVSEDVGILSDVLAIKLKCPGRHDFHRRFPVLMRTVSSWLVGERLQA